ncbi:MAG: alpha/beta hydrolase [Ilumatobacter sp.]|nr:alpha/beta hydrolase [Ilumatobacter sp.]
MLFAHGFGCDQHMWRFVAPPFEDRYRIVLFDHIGCGGSDASSWDPLEYSALDRYADDVIEIIDELDLGPTVFVGHSVSAMMGVVASIRRPELFAGLVLIGPSPCYVNDRGSGYVGGFEASDIDGLIESLDNNYLGWSRSMAPVITAHDDRPELAAELAEAFCRVEPSIARQFARVTFLSDNRDDLDAVSVPTTILQCTEDAIAPTEVGDYVHERIPDSRLVHIDTAGHCPHLSDPEPTAAAIGRFLEQISHA